MQKLNKRLSLFLIALIVSGTLIGCLEYRSVSIDKPKEDYSNITENPNISIPGYESLNFIAGSSKQSVDFYNPEENTCYFKISLLLKSNACAEEESLQGDKEEEKTGGTAGAADSKGEVLWTSDYNSF